MTSYRDQSKNTTGNPERQEKLNNKKDTAKEVSEEKACTVHVETKLTILAPCDVKQQNLISTGSTVEGSSHLWSALLLFDHEKVNLKTEGSSL